MKLKLGFCTLNEELSLTVFEHLKDWYKKYFGDDLDEKRCQTIINEYRIVATTDNTVNYNNLLEYNTIRVTIKNDEVRRNLMLKAPFFDFYLGTYIKNLNTKNDSVFEEIIRGEKAPF